MRTKKMKFSWLKKDDNSKLLIFFGGFASDERLLKPFDFADFDVIIACDYSDLNVEIPPEIFAYKKVYTLAWSFGIWVADFFKDRLPSSQMRIALNGSFNPISDEFGIPQKVFDMTLENFSESAREKFFMRVFGVRNYQKCKNLTCARDATLNKQELASLAEFFAQKTFDANSWNIAYASKSDKIFPLKNLERAWQNKLKIIEGEHFPLSLFENGITKIFESKNLVETSFSKAFSSYNQSAIAQKQMAENLFAKLSKFDFDSESRILEIGAGTGLLTKLLTQKFANSKIYLNDISEQSQTFLREFYSEKCEFLQGDSQQIELPKDLDLIVSSACFQWISPLGKFVEKLSKSCKDGATLAFSTFLPNNLLEVKSITQKTLSYPSFDELKSILTLNNFEVLDAQTDSIKLEFADALSVLKHLKNTGVKGNFSEFWTPKKLRDFSEKYTESFKYKNGVSLTYEAAYFIAKFSKNKD